MLVSFNDIRMVLRMFTNDKGSHEIATSPSLKRAWYAQGSVCFSCNVAKQRYDCWLLLLSNVFCLLTLDRVKEDEMGRACNTNGGEEECR
jgi:hypothetical protein